MFNDYIDSLENKNMYVIIPTIKKESRQKGNINQFNNNVPILNMATTFIKSKYNQNQIKQIIKSGNYVKESTQDIAIKFFNIGNLIDKSLKGVDLTKYNIISKDYIDKIILAEIDTILSYKQDNCNTIKEQLKALLNAYNYPLNGLNRLCIYLYTAWEINYLYSTNNIKKLPVLFERHNKDNCSTNFIDSRTSRIDYFLEKYSKYSKINFCLIKNNQANLEDVLEYDLSFGTSEICVPIYFEVLSSVCSGSLNKRYVICDNTNCKNLFLQTRNNRLYCNTPECMSDIVQQNKKQNKN